MDYVNNQFWLQHKNKNTNIVQKPNAVLVAVCHFPLSPTAPQWAAVRIKAYIGDIRNPIGVIPEGIYYCVLLLCFFRLLLVADYLTF